MVLAECLALNQVRIFRMAFTNVTLNYHRAYNTIFQIVNAPSYHNRNLVQSLWADVNLAEKQPTLVRLDTTLLG